MLLESLKLDRQALEEKLRAAQSSDRPRLHKEGVTVAVLSTRRSAFASDPNYPADSPATSGLAGAEHFSTWQDAQLALPVGMDQTMEQSPAALETNNADDT
jgi:hypothetical protein